MEFIERLQIKFFTKKPFAAMTIVDKVTIFQWQQNMKG
jgi:hypothetical protein